jgi:hypothetical protein
VRTTTKHACTWCTLKANRTPCSISSSSSGPPSIASSSEETRFRYFIASFTDWSLICIHHSSHQYSILLEQVAVRSPEYAHVVQKQQQQRNETLSNISLPLLSLYPSSNVKINYIHRVMFFSRVCPSTYFIRGKQYDRYEF